MERGNFIVESAKKGPIYAFGEENNARNYNICMTNLYLHDIFNKRIKEENGEKFQLVDLAIANPPFVSSMREDVTTNHRLGELYFSYAISKSGSSYVKYLAKMLENVHEKGRVAILMPHGFLFKRNKIEYEVRKKLIEKNYIDAIIGLPEKLFYHTKIPVVLLLIDKAKKQNEILFMDASREFASNRKINYLAKENQEKIVKIYQTKESLENYSYLAKIKEIRKKDYDLTIKKYVQIHPKIERIDERETIKKIQKLEEENNYVKKQIRELMEKIQKL